MPDTAAERKKWFLKDGGGAEKWVWEAGRVIHGDFFNAYLDFNSEISFSSLITAERQKFHMSLTYSKQTSRSSFLASRCRYWDT